MIVVENKMKECRTVLIIKKAEFVNKISIFKKVMSGKIRVKKLIMLNQI